MVKRKSSDAPTKLNLSRQDLSSLQRGDIVALDFAGNHNQGRFFGLVVRPQSKNDDGVKIPPTVIIIEARDVGDRLSATYERFFIIDRDQKADLGLPGTRHKTGLLALKRPGLVQNYYVHFQEWGLDITVLRQPAKPGETFTLTGARPSGQPEILEKILNHYSDLQGQSKIGSYKFDLSDPDLEKPVAPMPMPDSEEVARRREEALKALRMSSATRAVQNLDPEVTRAAQEKEKIDARLGRIEAQKAKAGELSKLFTFKAEVRSRKGNIEKTYKYDAAMKSFADLIDDRANNDYEMTDDERAVWSLMDRWVGGEIQRAERWGYKAELLSEFVTSLAGPAYVRLKIDGSNIDEILDVREAFLKFAEEFTNAVQDIGLQVKNNGGHPRRFQYALRNACTIGEKRNMLLPVREIK